MVDREILETFLNCEMAKADSVLNIFASLPKAIAHLTEGNKENFVYIPGSREDRVLLTAHADTVFLNAEGLHSVSCIGGIYMNTNTSDCGIGADDRAGCAILYALKDSGHSLLILDGEEYGGLAANNLRLNYPEVYNEINNHQYIMEFDRCNAADYKTYNIPVSKEFTSFVENEYKYKDAGRGSFTDICALCRDICGVNLSVGYYNQHSPKERLIYKEWQHTLDLSRELLSKPQPKFWMTTNNKYMELII